MTQDEIIHMAREAGGIDFTNNKVLGATSWLGTGTPEFLERFAVLVATHERKKQAEHEPVGETLPLPDGTLSDSMFTVTSDREFPAGEFVKLYAAPVRTKDLADDEIGKLICQNSYMEDNYIHAEAFARAVIAADREKNK